MMTLKQLFLPILRPLYSRFLRTFLVNLITCSRFPYRSNAYPANSRPLAKQRTHAVKQALAYTTDHAAKPPTVLDICQAVGVSKRTLEYAFLEYFGVSPKSYLQAYRLNGVRKTLRESDPGSIKIADVANRWGFWHMGQFARDYYKLFGELPSETLKYSTRNKKSY